MRVAVILFALSVAAFAAAGLLPSSAVDYPVLLILGLVALIASVILVFRVRRRNRTALARL
jgi:LPXTG-motif cell wall-anchored protein